ncbi:hypothetical protein GH714_041714 [Hevea brasiliensis]|uniref:DUF1421 domain-containing protein n=1 Tax=Hevea brasiliensis TaxID=3981 RepID=A0A6A6MW05_HEVBR|nr:hypothetical protein GH714_041714 [Hevea brasiliensis]
MQVQTGVHLLKEKQEIVEAQLQLTKMQVSKGDRQQSETKNSGHMDTVQQAASAPPQSHQQLQQAASAATQSHQQLPPITFPQFIPPVPVPPPAVPPPPITQQNLLPPAPLPNQLPQSQIPSVPQREPYYLPPGQTQEPSNQLPQSQITSVPQREPYYLPPGQTQEPPNPQYQVSPSQQPQPSRAGPPHQSYQLSLNHSTLSHPKCLNLQFQYVTILKRHLMFPLRVTHQAYASHPLSQLVGLLLPQFYGAPSHIFEPPSIRPSSGFSAGYGPPSGSAEPYPHGGPPSQYGSNPPMKPQQLSSLAMSHSGGSGYPQLPTARILPQALPTASGVGGGSSSSGTGNRVPIDDVVDKVTNMGFPREHVRATVRKLTENGESVDLNIVLDKLMNDGEVQSQRSWLGR